MLPPTTNYERPPRPRRRARAPGWLIGTLLGLIALAVLALGYLTLTVAQTLLASGAAHGAAPGATRGPAPTAVPVWAGTQRLTILVMGMDSNDTTLPSHTDSMMLVSVDPVSKTVVLISIPRDLWVTIPGYGQAKITEANFDGDAYAYPGGGPALAVQTTEQALGVHIDHYVRLDFHAFETFIDAIGGIDVNVPEAIDDPTYPDANNGYEPFTLAAGPQHLNGHNALRYARTRHSGEGDLDRARRQQQVILAVRDRLLNLNLLPGLLAKAPLLYQSLLADLKMDLTLNEVLALAELGQKIPTANITSVVIDYSYVTDATSPDGQAVLIGDMPKIHSLLAGLLSTASPNDAALMNAEGATVEVLNGAGVTGLGQATATWLRAQGINVVSVGTADRSDYAQTQVVDYTGKPHTAAFLARLFHLANPSTSPGGASAGAAADIVITLGQDWAVPAAGSTVP